MTLRNLCAPWFRVPIPPPGSLLPTYLHNVANNHRSMLTAPNSWFPLSPTHLHDATDDHRRILRAPMLLSWPPLPNTHLHNAADDHGQNVEWEAQDIEQG